MFQLPVSKSIEHLRRVFTRKIRLLFIDDHLPVLDILKDGFFTSPLLACDAVSSIEAANRALHEAKPYHGVVLDLSIESKNDGLTLLANQPYFYYCIAFSGAQSMEDATVAIQEGCIGAYDKHSVINRNPHKFIFEITLVQNKFR